MSADCRSDPGEPMAVGDDPAGTGRTRSSLQALAELVREQGGLMASLLASDVRACDQPGPAQTVAGGPRARRAPAEYELLVEAIYEGYLLHYGAPRVIESPEADLCLLAGDRLYALGLARLVELEDTVAVAELADTITLSALAHSWGEPKLAQAIWAAGARAVGWGSSAAHRRAKQLVFDGTRDAIEAMRTSAHGVLAPH